MPSSPAKAAARRAARRAADRAARPLRSCAGPGCSAMLAVSVPSDARFCGGACRVRAWRNGNPAPKPNQSDALAAAQVFIDAARNGGVLPDADLMRAADAWVDRARMAADGSWRSSDAHKAAGWADMCRAAAAGDADALRGVADLAARRRDMVRDGMAFTPGGHLVDWDGRKIILGRWAAMSDAALMTAWPRWIGMTMTIRL